MGGTMGRAHHFGSEVTSFPGPDPPAPLPPTPISSPLPYTTSPPATPCLHLPRPHGGLNAPLPLWSKLSPSPWFRLGAGKERQQHSPAKKGLSLAQLVCLGMAQW